MAVRAKSKSALDQRLESVYEQIKFFKLAAEAAAKATRVAEAMREEAMDAIKDARGAGLDVRVAGRLEDKLERTYDYIVATTPKFIDTEPY